MLQRLNPRLPDPIDANVGAKVRAFRVLRKMSQEKLAEHLGITFQQVQKYEKGTNRISASKLVKIARALDISPASLLADFLPEHAETNKLQSIIMETNTDLKERLRLISELAKA